MITLSTVCLILSCVSFFLGGFSVVLGRANWLCLGFAFWVLSFLLGGGHVLAIS